jgi:methylated-DNA-[protein]-cysteine S-methyltransferase
MEKAHIQTPLGIAKITGNENGISSFLFQMKELFRLQLPVLQAAVTQLNEYFEGET